MKAFSETAQLIIERIYRSLYLVRRAEEEVARIYPTDKIKSPVHLSIGQESISVGVCDALTCQDIVFGTYRSHALYLAKTADLKGFFAELYGKSTGCCKGKGGSMHLANSALGMMGTSAVVATTIPQAVGYAYALKKKGDNRVVAVFFGDGATEEGVFSESLNFAALKKLPIIFICENNSYAIHTHQQSRQAGSGIANIAKGYGINSVCLENNDVLLLRNEVLRCKAEIASGNIAPFFIECATSRWKEHVGPGDDFSIGYRTAKEIEEWKKIDPLLKIGSMLPIGKIQAIELEVENEILEAVEYADVSPFPEPSELYSDLFEDKSFEKVTVTKNNQGFESRSIGYAAAILEAFDQELSADESVVVFGLDVDDPKAILGTTKGLPNKFGVDRVFGTPLAEDAMTGVAIGMSLAGLRPVHIHIRMDFMMLAMNQIVNIAAKTRYMFGAQNSVPIVIRAMIGRSWGQGAQHSQAFHSFFMHVPGIKVVAPSNPYDAKGCMIAAIRDNNPVVYVEHRLLHYQEGPVPEGDYEVTPGKARIATYGSDVTILGISYMQIECLRAQKYLDLVGIKAEIIDPIWLSPFDYETLFLSVKKTRKLIIVDTGWTVCGAGSEIASKVMRHFEGFGDIRIRQLGFKDVVCPTSPVLEDIFYPSPVDIASLAYELVFQKKEKWIPSPIDGLKDVNFKGPF